MRCGCRGDSWIPLGAAFLTLACAGAAPKSAPNPAAVSRAPPREHSDLVESARAWPRAGPPFVSSGHGAGDFTIDIRVSPDSVVRFRALTLGQSAPAETRVVAFHTRHAGDVTESSYAMQKRPDGVWDFSVVDSGGGLIARGSLPLCERCHAEAPTDFLFVPSAFRSSRAATGDGGS